MTRILLTLAAVALTSAAADAGPVIDRIAANCQARQEARQQARAARQCQPWTPVRDMAHAVAQAQPVRTAVADFAMTFSRVCGPNGCR